MAKRTLSLLLCLIMIFSLSIGCMTNAGALELSDIAAALPVITSQPQDAVIEGTGSATFSVNTVFDTLLDQLKSGDFDLEAWLKSMLEQGLDVQSIIGILEELGFNSSDIINALLNSGIDWEQILSALQGGGFDLEQILGQLMQDPNFDPSALIEALQGMIGSSDLDIAALIEALQGMIGSSDLDIAALIQMLTQIAGTQAMPLAATEQDPPAEPVEIDVDALLAELQPLLGDKLTPEMIEQIEAALNGNTDLDAVIAEIQEKLGTDIDIATIIAAIQAATNGELDTEALIQLLVGALGDQLDVQELIETLKDILGDDFDLEAVIKALINGGFDLDTLLEILLQMGYTPEDLFDLLIGNLISYQWYTRVGADAVPVTDAQDANDYDGADTKTLTVTRAVAPAETEQYTYFCTVAVSSVTYASKDAVLTILVPDPTPDQPDTPDEPILNTESHIAYIHGYEDGTVRPEANITRAETAQIFYNLLTDESRAAFETTSCSFTDVPNGKWYTTCVATLAKAGILHGYEDGSFKPNAKITRAEMAAIISRFAELTESSITFRDIQGHWAQKEIELAASNGWVLGYPDGTFHPDQNIKRDETVAMINRVLGRKLLTAANMLPGMKTFSDNQDPFAWYYVDIQEAANSHDYSRDALGVETWTELT